MSCCVPVIENVERDLCSTHWGSGTRVGWGGGGGRRRPVPAIQNTQLVFQCQQCLQKACHQKCISNTVSKGLSSPLEMSCEIPQRAENRRMLWWRKVFNSEVTTAYTSYPAVCLSTGRIVALRVQLEEVVSDDNCPPY